MCFGHRHGKHSAIPGFQTHRFCTIQWDWTSERWTRWHVAHASPRGHILGAIQWNWYAIGTWGATSSRYQHPLACGAARYTELARAQAPGVGYF